MKIGKIVYNPNYGKREEGSLFTKYEESFPYVKPGISLLIRLEQVRLLNGNKRKEV